MNIFEIANLARQAAVVAIKDRRDGRVARRWFAHSEIRRVLSEHGIHNPAQADIDRLYDEAVEEVVEEREVDAQAEAHYDEIDRQAEWNAQIESF